MVKAQLRREFGDRRRNFVSNSASKVDADRALNSELIQFLAARIGTWGGFCARPFEPNINAAILKCRHLKWAYPSVQNQTTIDFLIPRDAEAFQTSSMGIIEPHSRFSQRCEVFEINGLLVPGLAFDSRGTRLGSGRGYFDRYLAHSEALKIGVAYKVQLSEHELPTQDHDVPMDFIITEEGILTTGHRQGLLSLERI